MLRFIFPCQPAFLALLLLLGAALPARAQDEGAGEAAGVETDLPGVMLRLGGTLQPRFSYGALQTGAGAPDAGSADDGEARPHLLVLQLQFVF